MGKKKKEKPKQKRENLIRAITAPLGFFVLCLLIVELFIASVIIGAQTALKDEISNFLYLGVGMFIFVIGIVSFVVWARPENLTFTEAGHLQMKRELSSLSRRVESNEEVQRIIREAMFFRGQKDYRRSEVAYQRALTLDSNNDEASVGLAVVKYLENTDKCSVPLKLLSAVIERNPDFSSAYYNRACIRCADKSKDWGNLWIKDLKKAIKKNPTYKVYAQSDEDFKSVRNEPFFLKIVS